MGNRFGIVLSLCMFVVAGWLLLVKWNHPEKSQAPTDRASVPVVAPNGAPPPTPALPIATQQNTSPSPSTPQMATPGQPSLQLGTSPWVVVESKGIYRARLNDHGMYSFLVLEPRYTSNNQRILKLSSSNAPAEIQVVDGYQETEMIPTYKPSLTLDFPDSQFSIPQTALWTLETAHNAEDCQISTTTEQGGEIHVSVPEAGCKLTYRVEIPNQLMVRKVFFFQRNAHRVDVRVEINNLSQGTVKHHLSIALESAQDPKKPGMFSAKIPERNAAWSNAGSIQKATLEDLMDKKDFDKTVGDIRWFGFNQQYFIQSLVVPPAMNKKVRLSADGAGSMSIALDFQEKLLQPKETASYLASYYAGPKIPERLSAVNLMKSPEESSGLQDSIDYTLGIIARPMLWTLRHIHGLFGSWGISIILLTLLVKLLTIYPTYRTNQSMKAMAELKPKIDELQQRYKDDKQKMQVEIASLYKKHGINPLGGCLPMILQMPVYIALYSTIGNSIELYRAPLLTERWIQDLTAADPFFILPIVTGLSMFLQTRLSPSSGDPQQKAMALVMPVIFTGFSIFLPAGLTLYIFTNTLLGMVQQFITNRLQHKAKKPSK